MKNRTPEHASIPEAPECIIELDLSRHCIQTAARRHYEKLLGVYFKTETGRSALEAQIDLLHNALEALDFPALRSRWPELAGGRAVKIRLCWSQRRIVIRANDHFILAPLRAAVPEEDPKETPEGEVKLDR